jgi:hypothetical protein
MADRTLTINHADGGSETYTINRDKFAGVRSMSTNELDYDEITVSNAASDVNGTWVLNGTSDGRPTWRHPTNSSTYIWRINTSGSKWFIQDNDNDPKMVQSDNTVYDYPWDVPSWKSFGGGVNYPNVEFSNQFKTLTVDHTAVAKEQSKETTFGGSQSMTVNRDIEPLLSKVVGGASAAYSLRDLNDKAGNNKVVRVRRASDNHEKDFRAKEVKDIANWVNTQTTLPLDIQELEADGRTGDLVEAAAAYSLRNLSASYTGNVVDVRRSSDDAVESFTATEVANGTLEDWVSTPQVGWNIQPTFSNSGGGAIITSQSTTATTATVSWTGHAALLRTLPKVNYVSAKAGDQVIFNVSLSGVDGHMTFRLRPAGSNSNSVSVTVHNGDNQDVVLNLNSDAGYIANTATASVGGATLTINSIKVISKSAYVSQWYDQSGNDNHATQGTNAKQPKIVDGGTYLEEVEYSSGKYFEFTTTLNFENEPFSMFAYLDATSSYHNSVIGGNGANDVVFKYNNVRYNLRSSSLSIQSVTGINAGDLKLLSVIHNDTTVDPNLSFKVDGSTSGIPSFSSAKLNADKDIEFLGAKSSTNTYVGSMREIIIYNSDQSDNRTAIEANIGDHYNIDLPSGVDTGYDQVDGFVETWYDQSGNGNDATQTVAASQPKIVDAGVLVSGGLDFDGVSDHLVTSNFLSGSNFSAFSVLKCTDISSNENQAWNFTDTSSEFYGFTFNRNSSGNVAFASTTPDKDLGESSYTGNKKLFSTFSGTSNSYYSDGTESVLVKLGRHSPSTGNTIGSQGTSGRYLEGSIEELIVYNSDQSANREAIEANINNQYDIY